MGVLGWNVVGRETLEVVVPETPGVVVPETLGVVVRGTLVVVGGRLGTPEAGEG